jgi:cellulase (glycosyl hydrolase family 5)
MKAGLAILAFLLAVGTAAIELATASAAGQQYGDGGVARKSGPKPKPSAGASPIASPIPDPSTSPSPTPGPGIISSGFVTDCGTSICLNGSAWKAFGASVSIGVAPNENITLATGAKLNAIRLVNFLHEDANDPTLSTAPYDPIQWGIVDSYIAVAAQNRLHVVLDLSTFRNLAWNNCSGPAYDWNNFLSWVANRVNTVDGAVYRDDATIAVIAIAGEYNVPKTYSFKANNGQPCTLTYSTNDLNSFFARTLAQGRNDFPSQLVETGGLLYLDWNSGIDWKTIMGDPDDQICSIHMYSSGDVTTTVPNVSSYCASLGKPWIVEEFGFPQSDGDTPRASEFLGRYSVSTQYGAAGTLFWNVGPEMGSTFDVNPQTPVTWTAVLDNAPS